jgi:endonuclease VIII
VPEGDTVHRWAGQLHDALVGRPLRRAEIRRDPRGLRPPEPGVRVTDVEAHGKHLLVRFDDGATLHTHMMMQGVWHVYRSGARWRRPAHQARVVLEVDTGSTAVCFNAPVVELRREHATRPASRASRSLARLGPDLSDAGVDLEVVLSRLAAAPSDTTIGDALLDQRIASGLGNVFKSEVCWACRVHPATPIGHVSPGRRRALYETAHAQLSANRHTHRRVTYRDGLAIYGKVRRPCPRCRTPIRRAWQGAEPRVTYWCPTCQSEPDAAEPEAAEPDAAEADAADPDAAGEPGAPRTAPH